MANSQENIYQQWKKEADTDLKKQLIDLFAQRNFCIMYQHNSTFMCNKSFLSLCSSTKSYAESVIFCGISAYIALYVFCMTFHRKM